MSGPSENSGRAEKPWQFQPGQSVAAHLPDLVAQTRAARDAGFKSLWFPHHYLTGPLQMLQIVPMMAYLAQHAEGMLIVQAIQHGEEHRQQVCSTLGALGIDVPDLSGWEYWLRRG